MSSVENDDLLSEDALRSLYEPFDRMSLPADEGAEWLRRVSPGDFETFIDEYNLQAWGYASSDAHGPEYAVLVGIEDARGYEPLVVVHGPADTAEGVKSISAKQAIDQAEATLSLVELNAPDDARIVTRPEEVDADE